MATYSKVHLSGSTDGLPIPVAATATPGTLVHTAVSGTSAFDEVYLWVSNVTGVAATLTLEWGGVTDPTHHLVKGYSIAANSGPIAIAVGQQLNNAKVVRAFSGTGSALNIVGFIMRLQ